MEGSSETNNKVKLIRKLIFHEIRPLLEAIVSKYQLLCSDENQNDAVDRVWNMYKLCSDQIRKCILIFIEVLNNKKPKVCYQDTLQCLLERLLFCHEKLKSIDQHFDKLFSVENSVSEDSILINNMYFVNWIDQTFEILNNLSNLVYNAESKSNDYEKWKEELVVCVSGIHKCVDEMLLSAMTLCKYCLPSDQLVVKARCQVVLRETKALLSDLIKGNMDSVFQATKENLILPINPSNINVLIDVLKDVLYVLETNTNTALLALLINCFAYNELPVEVLKKHFKNGECSCGKEECNFVKDFDFYNERLMQIGSFAVSCSSDENRVLSLRSGLASLEALDPHLVPAIMVSPNSFNSTLLIDTWKQEVAEIRDQVFLIVDPTAFAQKAKQMIHNNLLEIIKENVYNNAQVCDVINMGGVVCEFFDVYKKCEPDALTHREKLLPLVQDLNKAVAECKVVSNILSSNNDFKYPVKQTNEKATFQQLLKRLKLLYTIVNKISTLLSPEDDIFEESIKNETQTMGQTYINSPRKNITRSIFCRTTNIRSSTAKFPLAILTKNLKMKRDLSFSMKLDQLCDITEIKPRNTSILYSPMKKTSLRKAVLSRRYMKVEETHYQEDIDDAFSLQITDVLNEINNLTATRPNQTYNESNDNV